MFPSPAKRDRFHGHVGDSVAPCKRGYSLAVCIANANVAHLLAIKLCVWVGVTFRSIMPALLHHVCGVCLWGAQKQVFWFDAMRHIAAMQHTKRIWNWSTINHPTCPVCSIVDVMGAEHTVAILKLTATPQPATCRIIYKRLKSGLDFWSRFKERLSSFVRSQFTHKVSALGLLIQPWRMLSLVGFSWLATVCSTSMLAATGSWNGIAFTQWNGIAQTAWNGTGISCAGGGGSAPTIISTSALDIDLNADDPETFSFTTGAINNGAVVAAFAFSGASTVTSCTFDGTAMTKLTSANVGILFAELWGVKVASKSAGTYNVSPFGTTGSHFKGMATSWSGVNQTTPFGTGVTATGVDTAPTVAITSGANDIVIACISSSAVGTFTYTPGSGFTTVVNDSTVNDINMLNEYKQASSVADATVSATITWADAAVTILP